MRNGHTKVKLWRALEVTLSLSHVMFEFHGHKTMDALLRGYTDLFIVTMPTRDLSRQVLLQ